MEEKFFYPQNQTKATRTRMILWVILILLCWAFMLYSQELGAFLIVLFFSGFIILFEILIRNRSLRSPDIAGHFLIYDGTWLKRFAPNGVVVGAIDMTRSFCVKCNNGVYLVTQDFYFGGSLERCIEIDSVVGVPNRYIEFSSLLENAEHLVKDILKFHEWPPGSSSS